MKFHSPMLIVSDIEKSKRFYVDVLDGTVTLDLGAYVVMDGFSMMARETWRDQTRDDTIPAQDVGHGFELYFEESQLDVFAAKLQKSGDFKEFQPLTEAPWGQRTIRFLDPDGNVVEVSEPMEQVVTRLLASGLSVEQTSEKSMMPVEFIQGCIAEHDSGDK